MAVLNSTVTLLPSQQDALRSAMRDVQVSIGDYYRETGRTSDSASLATRVRACVGFIQVVNAHLDSDGQKKKAYSAYSEMFENPKDNRVEVIQAFKYARNLMQHVPHPVEPRPSAVFGGSSLGFRTYAVWRPVPLDAHEFLTKSTRDLKPFYDQHLENHEVTGTFLDAARFFHEVCPALVHRDANREWTGFPLNHQPGVATRLHPEEPHDQAEALLWMNQRRPGGDRRIISGRIEAADGGIRVFGLTFVGRCSLLPFFETVEQITADISMGYPYHVADLGDRIAEKSVGDTLMGVSMRQWLYASVDELRGL